MKYEGVCLAVKDVNLARKFYEELFGLEVVQDFGINISFSCGIGLQQDFDKIIGFPKEKTAWGPHNMELYFEEDDFDAFAEKLRSYPGVRYLHDDIKEHPWGQRSINFYDLDGHLIEVGENLKMVVKRFMGSGMSLEETSARMNISIPDMQWLLAKE